MFEADRLMRKIWYHLSEGHAKDYHALLSPSFKYIVNGEDVQMPWTQLNFVEELFAKIKFGHPVNKADIVLTGPRSLLSLTERAVEVKSTGELITFPGWSVAVTFDSQDLVSEMKVIVNGEQWGHFTAALGEPLDFHGHFETYCKAMSAGDRVAVKNSFHEQFRMSRNGQQDETPWTDDEFLQMLFSKTRWTVTLVETKQVTTKNVVAIMDVTVDVTSGPKVGLKLHWVDAWHALLTSEGKIAHAASIMDSAPFSQLDEALS